MATQTKKTQPSVAAAKKQDPAPSVSADASAEEAGLVNEADATQESGAADVIIETPALAADGEKKLPSAQTEPIAENAFEPEESEKHLYHVELDKPYFDTVTGKSLSKPFMQKFTEPEFRVFKASNANQGFKYKILYKP